MLDFIAHLPKVQLCMLMLFMRFDPPSDEVSNDQFALERKNG